MSESMSECVVSHWNILLHNIYMLMCNIGWKKFSFTVNINDTSCLNARSSLIRMQTEELGNLK